MTWGGRIMGGLPALLLLVDGVMKLIKPSFVVENTVAMGYPESCIVPLGIVLTASVILYLVPRTAVLGAILLTGYLGGAVDAHVHASHPAFNVGFPVFFGTLLWGGLFLRDARIRALIPLRSE